MPHRSVRPVWLAAPFAVAALMIAGLSPGERAPRVAVAQGNSSYAQVTFSGAVDGGPYASSQVPGYENSCVACTVDGSSLWLRTHQYGCDPEARTVTIDLSNAVQGTRVLDSDGDYTFEEGCNAPSEFGPVTLKTDGVNSIHDLIFSTESPWKGNALSSGIRIQRMALNEHRIGCDAFSLVYDQRLKVTLGSNDRERTVATVPGGDICTLYKNTGGKRSIVLGRFYVPMTFTVKKLP